MKRTRVITLVLVLIGFVAWPLVWQRSGPMAAVLAVVLLGWVVASVALYLRWARTLGHEDMTAHSASADQFIVPDAELPTPGVDVVQKP